MQRWKMCIRDRSWIDSGGLLPFPGGESREEFKRRNVTGFQKAVNGCLRNGISLAALVVHGGTIMNVMEEYADEDRSLDVYKRQTFSFVVY